MKAPLFDKNGKQKGTVDLEDQRKRAIEMFLHI